jgi:hypothetical protein
MIRLPAFWRRHFLAVEALLALLVTIGFSVWYWRLGGISVAGVLLKDNRGVLYGTVASIFGSLLGFVITATSIVLGFSVSERLAVVRESTQYPMLWKTFSGTIRTLAGATVIALVCLLVDRDRDPVPWLVVLLVV